MQTWNNKQLVSWLDNHNNTRQFGQDLLQEVESTGTTGDDVVLAFNRARGSTLRSLSGEMSEEDGRRFYTVVEHVIGAAGA
jgi:hypothetical protein